MAQPLWRDGLSVLILCAATLVFDAAGASAQSVSRSFTDLERQLAVGESITVTDETGHELAGKISELSPTSLTLLVDRQPRTFSENQVRRVQQRRFDSLWNGVLIGGGVGAAVGLASVIYWLIADPNECRGGPCMQDMLGPTIIGSLVGVGVDVAIKTNLTVYQSPSSRRSMQSRTAVLLVAQGRKGAGLTIRF
jgi:hypothetical protein